MQHVSVSASSSLDRLDPAFHIANEAVKERVAVLSARFDANEAGTLSRQIAGNLTQTELGRILDPLRRAHTRTEMNEQQLDRIIADYPFQTLAMLEAKLGDIKSNMEENIRAATCHLQNIEQVAERLGEGKPTLHIVRGHPGSGKSTYARHITAQHPGAVHIENDAFFTDENGIYKFDINQHQAAKEWCLSEVRSSLEKCDRTIVSNTFTSISEIQPYIDLGYPVEVIEMGLNYTDTHQVPKEVIEAKKSSFEPYPGATTVDHADYAASRPSPRMR